MGAAGVWREAQNLVDLLVMRLGPSGLAHMHGPTIAALQGESSDIEVAILIERLLSPFANDSCRETRMTRPDPQESFDLLRSGHSTAQVHPQAVAAVRQSDVPEAFCACHLSAYGPKLVPQLAFR